MNWVAAPVEAGQEVAEEEDEHRTQAGESGTRILKGLKGRGGPRDGDDDGRSKQTGIFVERANQAKSCDLKCSRHQGKK